jgi:hypothetical protein
MLPELSTVNPHGLEKRAVLPVPSAEPAFPPASVVTCPSGVILRIVLLKESAT